MAIEFSVNYLAVIVAAIASFIIGWIWYGPLFGKAWMRINKIGPKEMAEAKKRGMAKPLIVSIIASLLMAYVLALFVNFGGAASAMIGITVGFWIWIGFLITTRIDPVLWKGEPIGSYLIDIGQKLISLIVIGAILGSWS